MHFNCFTHLHSVLNHIFRVYSIPSLRHLINLSGFQIGITFFLTSHFTGVHSSQVFRHNSVSFRSPSWWICLYVLVVSLKADGPMGRFVVALCVLSLSRARWSWRIRYFSRNPKRYWCYSEWPNPLLYDSFGCARAPSVCIELCRRCQTGVYPIKLTWLHTQTQALT